MVKAECSYCSRRAVGYLKRKYIGSITRAENPTRVKNHRFYLGMKNGKHHVEWRFPVCAEHR